jgi:hypothetical protein
MITAMQLMLDDLLSKRQVYENAKMYECVASLTTSIEIAEFLLEKEKNQIVEAYIDGHYIKDEFYNPEEYYNQTYVSDINVGNIQINKKQHIIDIMKADEDDGLYNKT